MNNYWCRLIGSTERFRCAFPEQRWYKFISEIKNQKLSQRKKKTCPKIKSIRQPKSTKIKNESVFFCIFCMLIVIVYKLKRKEKKMYVACVLTKRI